MPKTNFFIGIMSGTSMDGVDAVLARFEDVNAKMQVKIYESVSLTYPDMLRSECLALNTPGLEEIHRAALVANAVAELYVAAVTQLLSKAKIAAKSIQAVGAHGQTVRHRPDLGYSVQLLNGAWLSERTGMTIICDFRAGDIAAGGQGAPLVPAFHAQLFGGSTTHVVLNLGGIANISILPADNGKVIGFDTGPANLLLDHWCQRFIGKKFDADGMWASQGNVVPSLLSAMLDEPFFSQKPPKSTGRDLFSPDWLARFSPERFAPQDVQATLLALTVESCAKSIKPFSPTQVLVCGGGALNGAIMAGLRAALAPAQVETTSAMGVDPMHVEALAFAWLAKRRLEAAAGNLPEVTGAKGARVLGAIYAATVG